MNQYFQKTVEEITIRTETYAETLISMGEVRWTGCSFMGHMCPEYHSGVPTPGFDKFTDIGILKEARICFFQGKREAEFTSKHS